MERIPFLGASEPFSSYTHLFACLFLLIYGIKVLIKGRGNSVRSGGIVIFLVCTVYLFSMSGVYHMLTKGTYSNYVLKILDHAGIYTMIVGSLTPIQIIFTRGWFRWVPLFFMWATAITGLTLTAIYMQEMPEWLLLSFFLTLGWMSAFTVYRSFRIDKKIGVGIVAGGLFYTAGALMDFTRWPVLIPQVIEAHEFFHILTFLGAFTHWMVVDRICKRPIINRIKLKVERYPKSVLRARVVGEHQTFEALSVDELKKKAREWANDHFYPAHMPEHMELKYLDGELIAINPKPDRRA